MDSEWHGAKWWRRLEPEERLRNAGIPKRYQSARLADFSGTARDIVDTFIKRKAANEGKSLIFTGRRADDLAAAAITDRLLNANLFCARFETAPGIVRMAYDAIEEGANMVPSPPYDSPWLYRLLLQWDVLVISGLGDEAHTEFTSRILGGLIIERYNNMQSTFVTTELAAEKLVERYGTKVGRVLDEFGAVRV